MPSNRCKVHRYRKLTRHTGRTIYKCVDCPHYLYDKAQIIGRTARCYNSVCENEFKITFPDLQKAKLTCGQCIDSLQADGITDILEMIPKEGEPEDEGSSLVNIVRDAIRSGSEQKGE